VTCIKHGEKEGGSPFSLSHAALALLRATAHVLFGARHVGLSLVLGLLGRVRRLSADIASLILHFLGGAGDLGMCVVVGEVGEGKRRKF
jgi:hypothetical protein